MEPKIATVSQINGYVKKILDNNIILNNVWIKGEISNFKHLYSGHRYITLKDEGGVLKAVMFRGSAQSLNFEPSDGMKVLARGRISVYEAGGSYQLYIEEMIPDGVGELYIAYEQLKKQLEEEGLFCPEYKKPIPKFPKRVGVVTASTGAAVRDIINVITRRYPMAEIVIYPAQVQGVGAAESVVKAIEYFNATNEVAEIAVPSIIELRNRINTDKNRISQNIVKRIESCKLLLKRFKMRTPKDRIDDYYLKIDSLVKSMDNCIKMKTMSLRRQLAEQAAKLDALSPLQTLSRGYSIPTKEDGTVIRSANDMEKGMEFTLRMKDGQTNCVVKGE